MMLLLLATASPAAALVACVPSLAVDSLPRNGAVDVPIDVAPAFVFSASLCGSEGTRSAELTREDDGTVVASVEADEIDTDALVEVFPDAALEPNTTYVLTLTDGSEVVTTFTTGEGTSAEVSGAPSITVRSAAGFPQGDNLEVTVEADPAGAEDALIVFLDEASGRAQGGVRSALGDTVEGEWIQLGGATLDEVCVTALQRNLAGDRVESDADCLTVTPGCGCATPGSAPGAFALLVGGIALLRRRRARQIAR